MHQCDDDDDDYDDDDDGGLCWFIDSPNSKEALVCFSKAKTSNERLKISAQAYSRKSINR
jgi:hypothetical protein